MTIGRSWKWDSWCTSNKFWWVKRNREENISRSCMFLWREVQRLWEKNSQILWFWPNYENCWSYWKISINCSWFQRTVDAWVVTRNGVGKLLGGNPLRSLETAIGCGRKQIYAMYYHKAQVNVQLGWKLAILGSWSLI